MAALLEVTDVTKTFGGLRACDDISLVVNEGEIVGLIGPNGAGKTTLFNCITRYLVPDCGAVKFQGKDIGSLSPYQICHRGMVRTFQIMRAFKDMTVLENVMVGAFCRVTGTQQARREAMKVLEFVGLLEKRDALAADLTVPDKKRLEVGRALATKPTLLLLDEAMAGLTLTETADAVKLVQAIRERGITVFLVEHVMEVIMPISNRVIVLNYGRKIAEGSPDEIVRNDEVIGAYLGEKWRGRGAPC
jgi:branched-chain amino acid transport system ATP-binding protein